MVKEIKLFRGGKNRWESFSGVSSKYLSLLFRQNVQLKHQFEKVAFPGN